MRIKSNFDRYLLSSECKGLNRSSALEEVLDGIYNVTICSFDTIYRDNINLCLQIELYKLSRILIHPHKVVPSKGRQSYNPTITFGCPRPEPHQKGTSFSGFLPYNLRKMVLEDGFEPPTPSM